MDQTRLPKGVVEGHTHFPSPLLHTDEDTEVLCDQFIEPPRDGLAYHRVVKQSQHHDSRADGQYQQCDGNSKELG